MNEALITHIYSICNGVFLAISLLMLFGAFSYAGQRHENGLANIYALLFCIVLGCCFYNIFWQHLHSPHLMPYYPDWVYPFSLFAPVFTFAVTTFAYIRVLGNKWVKMYTYSRQVKFIECVLYCVYLMSAVYLGLGVDIYTAHFILLANLLLFSLFALVFTILCANNKIGKVYASLFAFLTLFFTVLGYFSYTGAVLEHSFLMALAHICVDLFILLFCFIVLRYGYNELTGFYNVHTFDQFNIVRDLPRALSDDQLFVEYQPQVKLSTGRAVGAEVLVRWQHPTKGRIPPNDFIPLAEKMEIIDSLTQWLVVKAITQAKKLQQKGLPIPISMNFTPLNFNLRMVRFLGSKLQEHDLPPHLITVEMTENLLIKETPEVIASLKKLHEMGIAVSIDDYGKGYSSLSYLQKMSIDELKIDKSFVSDIDNNKDNYEIVRSTLVMAKNLSLHVVAEGVEDNDTENVLRSIDCETVQGFGIARPMNPDELIEWVAKRNAQ